MLQRLTPPLLVLLCGCILLGCASNSKPVDPVVLRPPAEEVRVNVYPDIPTDWLHCSSDPEIPADIKQDTDIPYQDLLDAWADCSSKLMKIDDLVSKWPKQK